MAESNHRRTRPPVRRLIALASVAAAVWLPATLCWGQDATGTQTNRDEQEVLDILDRSPATAMDVALLGVRQTEITAFEANKPQIFRRDLFRFLEVQYDSVAHVIFVEVFYGIDGTATKTAADECKDSIELAASVLTRKVPASVGQLVGSDDQRSLQCSANSYFLRDTIRQVQQLQITSPGWNICDSIRIVVSVFDKAGKRAMLCRRELRDKDIVFVQ